jgi:epoxide hydrolase 4
VRHFGASEAAIVGHDWGAGLAWAVAQMHPEYVWKLAALQVPPAVAWRANITWRQMLRSWYMLFFQLPFLPEWWMSAGDFATVEKMFKTTARPGTFTETDIAVYKKALSEPASLTSAINYYRANIPPLLFKRRDEKKQMSDGRIRVPTLFIYGERDMAVIPDTVRDLGRFIDAPYREVRIKTGGHWIQNEFVPEVNAALVSFLEES